jgi:hypothetical protein
MKIDRTLFLFGDGAERISELTVDFFEIANLFNRLLNEVYDGKRIKFLNIHFLTERSYELVPEVKQDSHHYYGGHLAYHGYFNRSEFTSLTKQGQIEYVWDRACDYLSRTAPLIKNEALLHASEHARRRGPEIGFNPDYRLIESELTIYGRKLKGAVWVNFKEDGMYSKFTLEEDGNLIYEQPLGAAKKGNEFFLDMYRTIGTYKGNIVLDGYREVGYLPLEIPFEKLGLS